MIRYPFVLKKGDVIGITAPSMESSKEKMNIAIKNIENLGFKILATSNTQNEGKDFVSSDAKTRADEFVSLYQNPDVKHIVSVRGGEFLVDILPYIHEHKNMLKINNPVKYFQGYSDNSLLSYYLTTNYNIASVHTFNFNEFAMSSYQRPVTDLLNIITGRYENNEYVQYSYDKYQLTEYEEGILKGYNLTENVEYKLLGSSDKNISVSGRLLGGTIDCLTQLLGTKFDNTYEFCKESKEGIIWYFDNCELKGPELYRRLFQLKNAGWFENPNMFLFGRNIIDTDVEGFDSKTAIMKALYDLNVPIIIDVDLGHTAPQLVLINGSYATFDYMEGKGKITEKFI